MRIDVWVDDEIFAKFQIFMPSNDFAFIETEIVKVYLNSLENEAMMRILEFIEIIEETADNFSADHPATVFEEGVLAMP